MLSLAHPESFEWFTHSTMTTTSCFIPQVRRRQHLRNCQPLQQVCLYANKHTRKCISVAVNHDTLSLSCNLTVAPSTYWVVFLLYHDLDVFLYLKWEDDKTYEIINLSCNLMVALSTPSAYWVDKSLHLDKHALLTSNKKMEKPEAINRYKFQRWFFTNVHVQLYNISVIIDCYIKR